MIKLENTLVYGFDTAVRSMRNPMNSWDKSDSYQAICGEEYGIEPGFMIGKADMELAKKLVLAGTDHSKFMRFITVSADITAPQFFDAELDTYKVATVRNSCSLQHKGASRPFTLDDFTVPDFVREILEPKKEKRDHPLIYDECEDTDFKIYSIGDREYKVFKNGKIVSCEFERKHEKDNRTRHFAEREIKPSQTSCGYYEINIGGRFYNEKWLIHRLIAHVWLHDSYFSGAEVNHKDGNKGHNSVDNIEWVTHSENEIHKNKNGLSGRTMHTDYCAWKSSMKVDSAQRHLIKQEYALGMKPADISEKYSINLNCIYDIIKDTGSKNAPFFRIAEYWENIISTLNELRELYLETGNYEYFRAMREIMPMGYNYRFTWQANYAVLRNIYHSRKNHALKEWHDFCNWIESLPYSELITMKGGAV